MEISTKRTGKSKMCQLACKLAREAIFGEELMAKYTVHGRKGSDPLPAAGLAILKETFLRFRYPTLSIHSDEFKEVWKLCTDALNHACNKPKLRLFENRSVQ